MAPLLLSIGVIVNACSDGQKGGTRTDALPTAATSVQQATGASTSAPMLAGPSTAGEQYTSQDVTFPPRNEPFDFRQNVLEPKYRDQLRRPLQSSFVNIEGTIVWTQEYLRYRVNGCSHLDAISRVFSQIEGRGIAPVCTVVTGNPTFPPRNEPFDFRQRLEAKYRDELRTAPTQTAVDIEGDIVWTQEYLRYRVSSCSHGEAVTKVVDQIDGRGVQPDCTPTIVDPPPPPPPPQTPCTYALNPAGNSVGLNGGTFTVNVSVQSGCAWQLSSNMPWLRLSSTSGSGSATVSYTVDPNASVGRNGRISLSGSGGGSASHDVSQAGTTPTPCAYSVSPNTLNVISSGGSVNFTVSTTAGCAWTAASQAGFVTITSGTSGSGTGTVNLSVAANTSAARSGTVLVSFAGGSQTVTVNQSSGANPTASASYTPDPCTITNNGNTLNCTFNGSGSSAGSGTIAAYIWSYLGTTVETAGPTHAPNFGGCGLAGGQVVNVPVTLTVRNSSNVMSAAFPFTVPVRKVNSCGFGQ